MFQKYHVQTLGQGMQLAINAFTLPTEYVWLRSQVLHYYLQGKHSSASSYLHAFVLPRGLRLIG
jgi:hypothetical protein